MKYMLLAYGSEDAWTDKERAECKAESTQLCHDLAEQGQFLGASPLHSVTTATCVKVRGEGRLITDGPFAETTEQLGGYFLIDVANLDEAIAVASRIPAATKGTIEIRPVFELSGLPQAK
ncbi:MAG: YciI family protein [Planctomycetes bacterium]|nr:YciI family protein [Planctomycetota bacterium]